MEKERFVVNVSEEALTDLRERLAKTRWPDEVGNTNWEYGTDLAYLKELVTYWQATYDWRQHERAMNAFQHYKVTIDGQAHPLHSPAWTRP